MHSIVLFLQFYFTAITGTVYSRMQFAYLSICCIPIGWGGSELSAHNAFFAINFLYARCHWLSLMSAMVFHKSLTLLMACHQRVCYNTAFECVLAIRMLEHHWNMVVDVSRSLPIAAHQIDDRVNQMIKRCLKVFFFSFMLLQNELSKKYTHRYLLTWKPIYCMIIAENLSHIKYRVFYKTESSFNFYLS